MEDCHDCGMKTKEVFKRVDELIEDCAGEKYAAFDADGTLWETDVGEMYFHYQIKNKLVPLPKDPWAHYMELKAQHPPTAYLWLAQIHAGVKIEVVRKWAKECFKAQKKVPFFEEQREVIKKLKAAGFKIFVVTASVKWAVEPGAEVLGIPFENVLGVQTKVENGTVTDQGLGEVTWKKGKAIELLKATKNIKPYFVSGNTTGDLEMLEISQGLCLTIKSESSTGRLRETEEALDKISIEKNWLRLAF